MQYQSLSYLPKAFGLGCLLLLSVTSVHAAKLYMQPDSIFVTSGTGQQFDVQIRVDDQTTNLKLFVLEFAFDPSKVDTVAFVEGTFWDTTGSITVFNHFVVNDTIIRLEGLVLGGGEAASGPGLLATVTFLITDTGRVDFYIVSSDLRDVNNDPFPHDASGAVLFVNVPPSEFNVISPPDGSLVDALPGDSIPLVWEHSTSVYPGEGTAYRLEYSTSPLFDTPDTRTYYPVSDTSFWLMADSLSETDYYWRVTAVGQVNGFERAGEPSPSRFTFSLVPTAPEAFDLVAPGEATKIDLTLSATAQFSWQVAGTQLPNDTMTYELEINDDAAFTPPPALTAGTVETTTLDVDVSGLPHGQWHYWQVTATNRLGLSTVSTSSRSIGVYSRGDLNQDGETDIGDLTLLIDHLFINFTTPVNDFFFPAADLNCQGEVDIADLTALIDLLFINFSMPPC